MFDAAAAGLRIDLCLLMAAEGNLGGLKAVVERYGSQWVRDKGEGVMSHAALWGRFKVLKWARAQGCPMGKWTFASAAEFGHLDVIRWMRQAGCPWYEDTCRSAANCGHLELLHWLRENGCPWDARTCARAARWRLMEVLQWARGNGCSWNEASCSSAAAGGWVPGRAPMVAGTRMPVGREDVQ